MVHWLRPLLAGCLLAGLVACSQPQTRPSGGLVAPPEPAAGEVIVLPEGGNSEEIELEVEAEGDRLTVKEVVVRGPDGTRWQNKVADDKQHRLDLEACYNYAHAQVRHDEQIWVDRNAAFDNITTDSRYSQMQLQQDAFEFSKRQGRLINSCMVGKGYYKL
jgi:hypothetical protein